jgi:hypothetical protein
MRIAVVAGGWHWPSHFFVMMAQQSKADLFVISHRDPELPVVREEKRTILDSARGPLADLDRVMYRRYADKIALKALGWDYKEAPNVCGDWCFFNQWLEDHDYHAYDVILNCHDDTFVRRGDLFENIPNGDWLLLANGSQATEPPGYVRGSFEFWKPELLDMLGGRINLGDLKLTREGLTDSPQDRAVLQTWNDTCWPLRHFMVDNGLSDRIARLSPHYRVSRWIIEGERGFLHAQGPAEWKTTAGMEAYPLSTGAPS